MEHEHSPEAIQARIGDNFQVNYIRDWIYGGIDGAVTTFAVVAGVVGAELAARIVVILGLANLIADGFSMAASNYSGTKAENDDYARIRAIEEHHIATIPEGEREEVREIFRQKGFEGEDLERAVDVITSAQERWIDTMMTEEHGLPKMVRSPWQAALSTFAAFLLCGAVPLLPFVFGLPVAFGVSLGLTVLVFFVIGSGKSMWSLAPWWWSGLETLAIGIAAATLAFLVGYLLKSPF